MCNSALGLQMHLRLNYLSTHKTFIKQINPSYIHGHSLVIGSVSWLTVLSELNSFCLGTQDDF